MIMLWHTSKENNFQKKISYYYMMYECHDMVFFGFFIINHECKTRHDVMAYDGQAIMARFSINKIYLD